MQARTFSLDKEVMSAAVDAKAHQPAAEPEEGIKITVVPENALSAAAEIKQAQ